jgi:hypothetical protein
MGEDVSECPGGGTFHVVDVVEFRERKIARETRYYGNRSRPPSGAPRGWSRPGAFFDARAFALVEWPIGSPEPIFL